MILFALLLFILLVLTVILISTLGVGVLALLITFGDIIICVWLILFILKRLFKNKKK